MSTLNEQIACVKREIGMRENVYPRWIAAKKMSQEKADRELATMRDVLSQLEQLRPVPEVGDTHPIVLYFGTRTDANEFVKVIRELKPGLVARNL